MAGRQCLNETLSGSQPFEPLQVPGEGALKARANLAEAAMRSVRELVDFSCTSAYAG